MGVDLFPMPPLCMPSSAGRSRGCRQRLGKQEHAVLAANKTIAVLNSLVMTANSSSGAVAATGADAPSPTTNQFSCMKRMLRTHVENVPPIDCPSPEEALSELLHSAGGYDLSTTTVAPYTEERVSLPEAGQMPADTLAILKLEETSDAYLDLAHGESRMLLSSEEVGGVYDDLWQTGCYHDPVLEHDPKFMRVSCLGCSWLTC